jgi:hypothetical protein
VEPGEHMTKNEDTAITKEAIEAYRSRRAAECNTKLAELLKAYDCRIVAMPQITADGRIVATMQIVAN